MRYEKNSTEGTPGRPYYPDICVDIDIADSVEVTSIRSITFLMGDLSNYGVLLEIKDKVCDTLFIHFGATSL